MKIIDIKNKNSLKEAVKTLKSNGILVFPTDTVYGIGCILNEKSIKKLYQIKNRPPNQPTAILLSKKTYYSNRSSVKSRTEEILEKYPKGQVTVIIDLKNLNITIPSIILKDNKVGIRFPDYPWLEELIDRVGSIVASSANKKGEPAPKNFDEIDPDVIKESDLVIESHEKLKGKPSIVYDLEENKIIRQ